MGRCQLNRKKLFIVFVQTFIVDQSLVIETLKFSFWNFFKNKFLHIRFWHARLRLKIFSRHHGCYLTIFQCKSCKLELSSGTLNPILHHAMITYLDRLKHLDVKYVHVVHDEQEKHNEIKHLGQLHS